MLLVAHRTPHTAAGCAELAAAGAGAFELDVQVIGGRLVVSHFVTLAGLPDWVEHDNWRFRVRGRGPRDVDFADMVALVPPECLVLLDPKLPRGADRVRLADALAAAIPDRGRFRVSTADPDDLARYRAAGFRTWRTIGDRGHLREVLAGGALPDEAVSVRHWLLADGAVVARLHERARSVIAWTVNDPARARRLAGWGVDGVTTDSRAVLTGLNTP
jgi:glycerophosphoryl diester phosphodiesterase